MRRSDRPPDPPTCRATHESGDRCSHPNMHRRNGLSTPHHCKETDRTWRGPVRPALDDEPSRIQFWAKNLEQHADRQDVIRNAATALALRDAEIARLMATIRDLTPDRGNHHG